MDKKCGNCLFWKHAGYFAPRNFGECPKIVIAQNAESGHIVSYIGVSTNPEKTCLIDENFPGCGFFEEKKHPFSIRAIGSSYIVVYKNHPQGRVGTFDTYFKAKCLADQLNAFWDLDHSLEYLGSDTTEEVSCNTCAKAANICCGPDTCDGWKRKK